MCVCAVSLLAPLAHVGQDILRAVVGDFHQLSRRFERSNSGSAVLPGALVRARLSIDFG